MTIEPSPRPVALVVDGNSVAHRAFHAYGRTGMVDSHGRPQEVCYGFTRLLAGLCDKVRDRHGRLDAVLVGFDSARNRRREADPRYKSSRPPTDESLVRQFDRLERLLATMGIARCSVEGAEADDVCASAAAEAQGANWRAVVATSDRDALAVVTEHVEVLQLRNGLDAARFLDPAAVEEHYGVAPSRYPLLAALRGDPSDDLPGIPGLGPKRAAQVAAHYADVDEALADPDTLGRLVGPRAAAALREGREVVAHNLAIMALDTTLATSVCTAGLPPVERVVTALGDAQLPALQSACAPRLSAAGPAAPVASGPPTLFDAPPAFDTPTVVVRRPLG